MHEVSQAHFSFRRRWLFRGLAVGLSLLPLVVAELAFRALGMGERSELVDPYVGFTGVQPLFVPNGERCETDSTRLAYFRPESFARQKSPREFRIFCLGGSTVQGRPYAIETAFSTWLEFSLQAADSSRYWEVINCGGISYASYRLIPIMREAIELQADLIIVYTGHNEFLEDRTYRRIRETPPAIARMHTWSSRFRVYNLARALCYGPDDDQPKEPQQRLPAEVDALLDYRGGLADYHRDDAWRDGAVDHFQFNLHAMVRLADDAGVKLLLINPVENLRDCAPFKSANGQLTVREVAEFERLWEKVTRCDDLVRRIELLEAAIALDSRHAASLFALAKCYDATGRFEQAKQVYIRAKDEDICPLRMIEPLHQVLLEVAQQTATPLVNARAAIESTARNGIPGDDWFLDHVHPSINGHQTIAQLIFDKMVELRWVQPDATWEERQHTAYASHLESLPAAYFTRGQQRLDGLRAWTQGLSPKLRPPGRTRPE